jgi:hypothetical protein
MQSSSDTGASKLATIDKGYFTLRAMTKEIQELSNPIGRELEIGPNDLAPIWCQILLILAQLNIPYNF